MKIIEFPSIKDKSVAKPDLGKAVENVTSESSQGDDAEIIDITALSEPLESETREIELQLEIGTDQSFYDKILQTAKDICADEADMAAAICTMVDELNKKTAPLRDAFFFPEKVFFKMVDNEHFESKYHKIITSFGCMNEYEDLNLTQTAVMLDKKWPFKPEQKMVIKFALHLLGATKHIDLNEVKAVFSENEWQTALTVMKDI